MGTSRAGALLEDEFHVPRGQGPARLRELMERGLLVERQYRDGRRRVRGALHPARARPGRCRGIRGAAVLGAPDKAVVRGRHWFEDLASVRAGSIAEIGEAEGVSACYVGHLIPLAFLAPDIVARILSGAQPVDLTTEALTKRIDLPVGWAEQRVMLGFD